MTMPITLTALFILLLSTLIPVSCDYKVELLLHNYKNPLHKLYNGRCCDSPSFTACYLHQCDNEFFFCLCSYNLESHDVPSTDPYFIGGHLGKLSCPEGWRTYTTGLIGYNSDNITFPAEGKWINENKRVRNPLTFTGDGQPSGFQLFVLVVDSDKVKKELVDILIHDWELSVSDEYSDMEVVSGIAGTTSLSVGSRTRIIVEDVSGSILGPTPPITKLATPQATLQTSAPIFPTTTSPLTTIQNNNDSMPIIVDPGAEVDRELAGNSLQGGGSDGSPNTATVVGAAVGGVLGALVILGLAIVVTVVVCVVCKKRRANRLRENESEVTALCNGPGDNPTYTGIVSNGVNHHGDTNSDPSFRFSNSLYGALTPDGSCDSHRTYTLSQPNTTTTVSGSDSSNSNQSRGIVTSRSLELSNVVQTPPSHEETPTASQYSVISHDNMERPIASQYSVISHDNMEQPIASQYSVISHDNVEQPIASQYSVISHDDIEPPIASQYSVVTQGNVASNEPIGYSVVSHDNDIESVHSDCSVDDTTDLLGHIHDSADHQQNHASISENVESADPPQEVESQYSVITRENMLDDGYSVVTRENLVSEASDSGSSHTYSEPYDSHSDTEGDAAKIRLLSDGH